MKETMNNDIQTEQNHEDGNDNSEQQRVPRSQALIEGESSINDDDDGGEVSAASNSYSNTHNAHMTQQSGFDDAAESSEQENYAPNATDESQGGAESGEKCRLETFNGDDVAKSLLPEGSIEIEMKGVNGKGQEKRNKDALISNKKESDDLADNTAVDDAENISTSSTSVASSVENERDVVDDIESNNGNVGSEERTPGVYPVEGRAPGTFPAWGRRRISQGPRRSTRVSSRLSTSSASESIVEATRVTDAEPVVYAQSVGPDEFEELSRGKKFRRRTRLTMSVFILVIVSLVALLVGLLPRNNEESQKEDPFCTLNDALSQCRCKGSIDGNPKIVEVCASGASCSELRQFLIDEQYMDDNLLDPCLVQNMALLWLANKDESAAHLTGTLEDRRQLAQRYVMATFYFALSGDNWVISADENRTWLTQNHVCGWEGISCRENHVAYLHLRGKNLTGMVPKELHLLDNLKILRLSYNNINGIWYDPSKINNMTNYRLIDLRDNKISGDFLSGIDQIGDLGVLNIMNNDIIGSIPTEMGNMKDLRFVFLGGNNIKGTLPSELGRLNRLEKLSLEKNNLTGRIPSEFGDLLSLEKLSLHSNQLNGTVPPQLGNLSFLEFLDVSDNRLTGPIPSDFGELKKLSILDMRSNNFVGDIADEICDLPYIELICIDDSQELHNTNCPMPSCLVKGQEWKAVMPGM